MLNRLVGLILGNIEFWCPIRAKGRQNLTEYRMDLKMVSKGPQRILMNLKLIFELVLLAIFVTNSVNVLRRGTILSPPSLGLSDTHVHGRLRSLPTENDFILNIIIISMPEYLNLFV